MADWQRPVASGNGTNLQPTNEHRGPVSRCGEQIASLPVATNAHGNNYWKLTGGAVASGNVSSPINNQPAAPTTFCLCEPLRQSAKALALMSTCFEFRAGLDAAHISACEFAALLKVERSTAWRWYKGEREVPHYAMVALSALAGLNATALRTGELLKLKSGTASCLPTGRDVQGPRAEMAPRPVWARHDCRNAAGQRAPTAVLRRGPAAIGGSARGWTDRRVGNAKIWGIWGLPAMWSSG